jgi:hypothetical protein
MLDKYLRVRVNVFAIKGTLPNENPVLTIPAKSPLPFLTRAPIVPDIYTTHFSFSEMQSRVATQ